VADDSGNLYGTTPTGGDGRAGAGIVFELSPDGTFTMLHRFGATDFDGLLPHGALTIIGQRLFGTTSAGGDAAGGTVFSLNVDGSGYQILHNFGSRPLDGTDPEAGLSIFSGKLWGTTFSGGRGNVGTVFALDPDGSEYKVVLDLEPGSPMGENPSQPPAFSDGRGFGICWNGGAHARGAIFTFLPDGSDARSVHDFDATTSNGYLPTGPLVSFGSFLYGVTDGGGPNAVGTVYSFNSQGTGFRILHGFGAGHADGAEPAGAILIVGGVIYGTTVFGGANDQGVVYALGTGDNFSILRSFEFDATDGRLPHAGLVLASGLLHGTTLGGGPKKYGTVFEIGLDGTGYRQAWTFGQTILDGWYPSTGLVEVGGRLIGTTSGGGSGDSGVIFSINKDGSDERILRLFDTDGGGGIFPGKLIEDGGILYGGAGQGGDSPFGMILRINPDGSGYTILHRFAGPPTDVSGPGSMVVMDSVLYGATSANDAGDGAIYSMRLDGSQYRIIRTFSYEGGLYPTKLIASGGRLVGLAMEGGISKGTVFSLRPDGSDFRVLHSFLGPDSLSGGDGDLPTDLIEIGGTFMGTTRFGGAHNKGTVYSIRPDGSGYKLLKSFDGSAGPLFSAYFGTFLTNVNGSILVTSPDAGPLGYGAIYSIDSDGGGFKLLYSFGNFPLFGIGPNQDLHLSGDGLLYGTTGAGGSGMGTIFAISADGLGHDTAAASAVSGKKVSVVGAHP
jgi:uncharacterized repeat protein (TIGR03803 family)